VLWEAAIRLHAGKTKLEFSEFIVEKNEQGVWRKCPYCNQKIWDGPHSEKATGFSIHISQKMPGHGESADWKMKYGKGSWQFGTLKN
jgi:hypothetical protein